MPSLQQGFDFARTGIQTVQQFTGGGPGAAPSAAPPAAADTGQPPAMDTGAQLPAPTGQPAPPIQAPTYDAGAMPQPVPSAGTPAAATNMLSALIQALQQRQIPPLPAPAALPYAAPQPPAGVPQVDGLSLLRTILGNPQFQQAFHSVPGIGGAVQRAVQLPLPSAAPQRARSVSIPMGAVMNAIAALAGQSMTELNETTGEDEPEVPSYLVGDDGDFIVDPASADDRAALVAHLFRIDEAQRYSTFTDRLPEADAELDECDEWARDAGFFK